MKMTDAFVFKIVSKKGFVKVLLKIIIKHDVANTLLYRDIIQQRGIRAPLLTWLRTCL